MSPIEGPHGNLRRLRTKRGVTQTEVAAKCGTSQQQIAYIETGERGAYMKVALLKALARYFKVSIDDLVK